MTKSFDFIFDFAGPNGYLVHKVLPDFCAQTGAIAHYVPALLGGIFKATGNRAPMIRYADAPAKLAYERLEFQRFLDARAITKFQFNPHFPVNSLLIMRGCIAAKREGCFMPYVEAMMAAMWEEGSNLADPAVAISALNDAGLDGARLITLADDPAVKAELAFNTDAAVTRGVFGIPTFFVEDAMFFGKERLGQVAEALAAPLTSRPTRPASPL